MTLDRATTGDPTLSDEDLQAACAPRGGEVLLERYGCLASLILCCAACVLVALAGRAALGLGPGAAVALAVLTIPLIGPGAYGLLHRASDRRREPLRAELRRRYGLDPLDMYAEEERGILEAPDGPAAVLLLSEASLPHGGRRWVRVQVWRSPVPRARVDVRLVRWTGGVGNLGGAELVRREAELASPDREELLALLDDPGPASLAAVPAHVLDGEPATVIALDREAAYTGTCNLGDLEGGAPEGLARHPTVRFAELLLRAGEAALTPPAADTAPRTPPRSGPS